MLVDLVWGLWRIAHLHPKGMVSGLRHPPAAQFASISLLYDVMA
jgi:hypothetical protein